MSSAGIIQVFNKVKNFHFFPEFDFDLPSICLFTFKDSEEAFAHGIFVTVSGRSHRWSNTCLSTSQPKKQRHILTAAIRVMNPSGGLPPDNGHFHG